MSGMRRINGSEWDIRKSMLNDTKNNSSAMYRSPSAKPSLRSSRSRITLVGYGGDLKIKSDIAYGKVDNANGFSWSDHLLAVFCIRRRGRYISIPTAKSMELQQHENYQPSPWILPVYVLSTEKDESRHFIPKEAKCTIDTGNLQGNIVSKTFLMEVLGYSESSFQPLTSLEEAGGTGVTGHRLIPQGAIHLTWYHSNSTRVFRDMRFLISEHPMHDLVIGSQSIHQNGILDVPNLADGIVIWNKVKAEEELNRIRERWNDLNNTFQDGVAFQVEVEESTDASVLKEYEIRKKEVASAHKKYIAENQRFQIRRYWTEYTKGHNTETLEKYRQDWRRDFPEIKEIPALDLTTL